MKREFSINILILLLSNLLIKPIFIFVIEANIQNVVGAAEYGLYFVLFDFVFLFVVFNDAGLQNYNAKYIAGHRRKAISYFGDMLGYKLVTGLLFAVMTVGGSMAFGYWQEYSALVLLIIAVFFVNSVFVLLRSSLSAMGKYRWDSWLSSLDKAILIPILGVLLWQAYYGGRFDIEWLPLSQLVVGIVVCIVALLLIRRTALLILPKFRRVAFIDIFRSSWPYALILLLSVAYSRIDAVMLDQLLPDGKTQSGYYAAAYRLIDAGNMVGFLFGGLLLPMFANMVANNESYESLFVSAYRMLFAIGSIFVLVCFTYHQEIFDLIYSQEYHSQSNLLQILILAFLPLTVYHSFGPLLLAKDKIRSINMVFLVCVMLNIALNLVLIPRLGAEGAAYTTLATQYLMVFGLMWLVDRNVDFSWKDTKLATVGLLVGGGIVFWGIEKMISNWMVALVISSVLYLLVLVYIRWIDLDFLLRRKR